MPRVRARQVGTALGALATLSEQTTEDVPEITEVTALKIEAARARAWSTRTNSARRTKSAHLVVFLALCLVALDVVGD